MLLLTQDHRARLIANGQSRGDHAPVVKFFSPVGAATWLFSELDEDGDILFGLCDLGFGCPEMGSASLVEIAAVTLPFGLTIDFDTLGEKPELLDTVTLRDRDTQQQTRVAIKDLVGLLLPKVR